MMTTATNTIKNGENDIEMKLTKTQIMSRDNVGVFTKYNRNEISDKEFEEMHFLERRDYSDDYGSNERYMKALMLAPKGLIETDSDKKMAANWAREGVESKDIVARFDVMFESSKANRERALQLQLDRDIEEMRLMLETKRKSKDIRSKFTKDRLHNGVLEISAYDY